MVAVQLEIFVEISNDYGEILKKMPTRNRIEFVWIPNIPSTVKIALFIPMGKPLN